MLVVTVPDVEFYDPRTSEFVNFRGMTLRLEHSLIALSKWESKWKIPYLTQKNFTREQELDYIRCMTITQNVPDYIYDGMSVDILKQINDYINDSMTATTISSRGGKGKGARNGTIMTSEVIYSRMASYHIPFTCEKWNLNRLLMLIRVCGEENTPPKKMSKSEILKQNWELNEARLRASGSKG